MADPDRPTCPKCGDPRVPAADCPRCGVVYAKARTRATALPAQQDPIAVPPPPEITGVSVGSTDDFRDMLSAVSTHELKPVVDSTFPLDRAIDAFRRLESGQHFGKVVIEL